MSQVQNNVVGWWGMSTSECIFESYRMTEMSKDGRKDGRAMCVAVALAGWLSAVDLTKSLIITLEVHARYIERRFIVYGSSADVKIPYHCFTT